MRKKIPWIFRIIAVVIYCALVITHFCIFKSGDYTADLNLLYTFIIIISFIGLVAHSIGIVVHLISLIIRAVKHNNPLKSVVPLVVDFVANNIIVVGMLITMIYSIAAWSV